MIRVLCVDISSGGQDVYDRLLQKASPERRCRADGYRQQADKLRCVTADAMLRRVLGRDDYRTGQNDWGKPCIRDMDGFFYNLSHSGRYVVLAWGDGEVGVDVQCHRETVKTEALAKRFFTPGEQAYVGGDRQRFYEVWTKKESYLKYIGTGLQQGLDSFSVLEPVPGLEYSYRILEGGYSLSLCAAEPESAFELLDVRQLV